MDRTRLETWRFTTTPVTADQVYLVVDSPVSPSQWMPMRPVADRPGVWSLATEVFPGTSRVRYFTAEGGAFLNCGNVGLHSERADAVTALNAADDLDLVA